MKRLLVFPLLFILLFSSCTNYSDIELKSIKLYDVKLLSTSRATIEVEYLIDNSTNVDIILSSADGFLTKNRLNFAQLKLIKSDTIVAASETRNRALFQLEILDPISLFSMGLNIKNWKVSDFEINARGLIRTSKGGRKVIKFKNMPLENLIKRL